MALARVKTWNPGDTLTAADLNAEYNNLLNNPISLVSPTTGAINFQTSVAHTNLQVSALTASSGFAGSVLVGSTATTPSPVWSTGAVSGGIFIATTASIPTWLAVGTSGQLLLAASSGIPAYSTGVNFVTTARSLQVQRLGTSGQATLWTSANISLGGGWSTAGTLTNIRGGDLACTFVINTSGIGAGTPTITTTYADGVYAGIPISLVTLGISSGAFALTQTGNSSGLTVTVNNFTPTSSSQYQCSIMTIA